MPKPVQKQLDNLSEDIRDRIAEKISLLGKETRPSGTKKLKGYDNEHRIRGGDYRIRYGIDDKESIVVVLHCGYRKDAYK